MSGTSANKTGCSSLHPSRTCELGFERACINSLASRRGVLLTRKMYAIRKLFIWATLLTGGGTAALFLGQWSKQGGLTLPRFLKDGTSICCKASWASVL